MTFDSCLRHGQGLLEFQVNCMVGQQLLHASMVPLANFTITFVFLLLLLDHFVQSQWPVRPAHRERLLLRDRSVRCEWPVHRERLVQQRTLLLENKWISPFSFLPELPSPLFRLLFALKSQAFQFTFFLTLDDILLLFLL